MTIIGTNFNCVCSTEKYPNIVMIDRDDSKAGGVDFLVHFSYQVLDVITT